MEEKRQLLQLVLQSLELHDRQLRWKYKKPYDSMASYKNDSTWLGTVPKTTVADFAIEAGSGDSFVLRDLEKEPTLAELHPPFLEGED